MKLIYNMANSKQMVVLFSLPIIVLLLVFIGIMIFMSAKAKDKDEIYMYKRNFFSILLAIIIFAYLTSFSLGFILSLTKEMRKNDLVSEYALVYYGAYIVPGILLILLIGFFMKLIRLLKNRPTKETEIDTEEKQGNDLEVSNQSIVVSPSDSSDSSAPLPVVPLVSATGDLESEKVSNESEQSIEKNDSNLINQDISPVVEADFSQMIIPINSTSIEEAEVKDISPVIPVSDSSISEVKKEEDVYNNSDEEIQKELVPAEANVQTSPENESIKGSAVSVNNSSKVEEETDLVDMPVIEKAPDIKETVIESNIDSDSEVI